VSAWTRPPALLLLVQLASCGGERGAAAVAQETGGASAALALADLPAFSASPERTQPSPRAAELPRATVDTRLVEPTGRLIAVERGDNLQRALDRARPGDVVEVEAGATFRGNFVLRRKPGAGWITIRSSATPRLPAPGTRVTPAHARLMPTLVSPNDRAVLTTEPGAHHYRIIGIEATVASSQRLNYGLVSLGEGTERRVADLPHHIVLDRVYLHGHPTLHLKRCLALNSAWSAVVDSYLAACHGKGQDTQAILGWNGPGPFKIENNHLEGAGENVMFGGADPKIPGLVPSDIEIRRNYFFKPPAWKGVWTVKNIFELKNAQRVLAEGNVLENNWGDAQDGFAIVWKSVNQDGACPWCVVQDVTFRYNKLRNSANGINLAARPQGTVAGPLRRVHIAHNVIDNINVGPIYQGTGRLVQFLGDVTDCRIEHNTMLLNGGNQFILFASAPPTSRLVVRRNIASRGQYGVFGNGKGEGVSALRTYAPDAVFQENVLVGGTGSGYPSGNVYAAELGDVGFTNPLDGNYRLAAGSAFRAFGRDRVTIGADVAAVDSVTRNVRPPTGSERATGGAR
jgi:hypothetical protein